MDNSSPESMELVCSVKTRLDRVEVRGLHKSLAFSLAFPVGRALWNPLMVLSSEDVDMRSVDLVRGWDMDMASEEREREKEKDGVSMVAKVRGEVDKEGQREEQLSGCFV